MAKILIIGDIMGRPGRRGLATVLPAWRAQYEPDVLIGNVENLAHGKGVTKETLAELDALGFDAYTSGNHIYDSGSQVGECFEHYPQMIRPANYVGQLPGSGYYRFAKNGQQYLVINLSGRVFFEKQYKGEIANPFFAFNELLTQQGQKGDIIIVDLHAEATSEKNAFGWHADGQATVVYGTHTHVPTADAKLLPKGTAYLTDVGMTGAKNSVIGVEPASALTLFLEQGGLKMDIPQSGPVTVNGLLVETVGDEPVKIERLAQEINL